ncbi:hypothetical protein TNCV_4927491 [Trichonephila clavipes]|nr:hypothetical protein TNCV_4927491 [Trichonephila clavipes]
MDRSNSDGYLYHQVHFRIYGCFVNHDSEKSVFRQVLMPPREHLMIRLPRRWVSFRIQLNRNTSISVGQAVDEVDIRQLGVRITILVRRTLFMSEIEEATYVDLASSRTAPPLVFRPSFPL